MKKEKQSSTEYWEQRNKERQIEETKEALKNLVIAMWDIGFWSIFISGFLYLGYWLVSKVLN